MKERYRIIISNKEVYKEFEIAEKTAKVKLGTTIECDFRLYRELFFEDFVLTFSKQKDRWFLAVSDNLYLGSGDVRKLLSKEIKHRDSLSVKYQDSDVEAFTIDFLIDFNNGFKKYERVINLENTPSLKIGCAPDCHIFINSPYTEKDIIELNRNGQELSVNIIYSTYGLFLNGVKADLPITIKDGDFFSIADFTFFYNRKRIWTEIRSGLRISKLSYSDFPIPENYPKFQRNTRLKSVLDEEEIEILDPPAKPKKNKTNLITSLLPAVGMMVSSGFMAMVGGSGMIIFSAITGGMAIITALVGVVQNRRDYHKEIEERIEKYNDYSTNKEMEIVSFRNDERKRLEDTYVDEKIAKNRIESFSTDLFDRMSTDDDFLDVRLGKGSVEAVKKIKYKKQEKLEVEDNLQLIPKKLSDKYQYITFAPVICKFCNCNAVGIIGEEENRFAIFKNIIIDICSRHFSSDVKLFFVSEKENAHRIDWLRFLPYAQNSDAQSRNFAFDEDGKTRLFDFLYKELSQREEGKDGENYIVFFYDECGFQNHPLSKFVRKAKELKVTFVFMKETKGEVPIGCDSLIYVDSEQTGRLLLSENQEKVTEFEYEAFDDATAKKLINLITPVYTEEISLESALTKSISLFEMLNILETKDLILADRWKDSCVYQSLAAPIGVTKSGLVYLDLHDKAHGPHGLVAGTTGSGKSELLQTYILSIATLFHPYEVSFVIIDFKGGGMVNQFKKLPHLLGAITNIDGKEINRSLKSIKAELAKREKLFSEANVNHIDKYIKKYKAGEISEPLPHIVLIVDEFAELRQDQPDFMNELISTARIGRSLGVHLILATQKPHGLVDDQIWGNSRFKLCLKVQNPEDSNEVLKSPLAAEIKEPGRAYFQVGNNEIFELFQSAYSGAPEKTINTNAKEFTIYSLDSSGRRTPIYIQKREKQSESTKIQSQLDALVKYIHDYCEKHHISKLPEICMPPLQKSIPFPKTATRSDNAYDIGIYDDPDNQIQASTYLDFDRKNTIILGSSQYGKTNLLQSVIRSVAEQHSPLEAAIYIIDFGSKVLTNFNQLNHVGGVVTSTDDEKLKNLFKLLFEEISVRKDKLVAAGVGSYSSYIEAGNTDIPRIYLIIDNLTALMELYMQDDDSLLTLIREGLSVGISTIATAIQLSGISYKYISNFANRISFYCNDSNDYYNLYNHIALLPDEIPGRCVFESGKRMLECQTYLAFEGEKEVDRKGSVQKFIDLINDKYQDMYAKKIPSLPQLLNKDYLGSLVDINADGYNLPIGLTYVDIVPYYLNIARLGIMGLCGKENTGHRNFINYLIGYLEDNQNKHPSKIVILDDFSRKFVHIKDSPIVDTYTLDIDVILETIKQWHGVLEKRYDSLIQEGEFGESKELLLLIIQNNDVAKKINDDWDLLEKFKDIVERYKGMNVAVIFTNYPNASIAYDAPEPIRMIKQEKHIIFFEDLDNLKPVEVPYEDLKANKKKLETGDAYYIHDNDVVKLKLVKSE